MRRITGSHVSIEMLFLWLVEFLLCCFVFYVLLLPARIAEGGAVVPVAPLATAQHAALLAMTIGLISICIGLYRPEICMRTRRLLSNTIVAGLVAFPAVLLVCVVSDINLDFLLGRDALWPMKVLICWIILLCSTRLLFRGILHTGLLARRVLILGTPPAGSAIADAMCSVRQGSFRVSAIIPAAEAAGLTAEALRRDRIWGVIHADPDGDALPATFSAAVAKARLRRFTGVEFCEQQLRRLDLAELQLGWLDSAAGVSCGHAASAIRRVCEIVVSLIVLLFSLPVLLLAVLAIKIDSRGPVLYRQERLGLHGRPITLLKLRSMRVDAEIAGPAWASTSDPRITRVGAFLRRSRIDELPQLINVLTGDMGFIGPRPERPHFVEQLSRAIPFYPDRAVVKPGVTGWAQVNYPYGASIEDARQKLAFDLYYVKHRSLFLDLLILFATVRVIVFQEGSR
jgi:exopolysaccharide biosynthesis polyprenyl glycosylphosphotransferase